MAKAKKFYGYHEAIAWIAINESYPETDPVEIAKAATVKMLAAVTGRAVAVIAERVAEVRRATHNLPHPQQTRAHRFIADYIEENNRAPKLAEIKDAVGVSLSRAHELVGKLVSAGAIRRRTGGRRGLVVLVAPPKVKGHRRARTG